MKPWQLVSIGVLAGLAIAAMLAMVARKKLMTTMRGDKPLPGGMDAKLEAFSYDMLNELLRSN